MFVIHIDVYILIGWTCSSETSSHQAQKIVKCTPNAFIHRGWGLGTHGVRVHCVIMWKDILTIAHLPVNANYYAKLTSIAAVLGIFGQLSFCRLLLRVLPFVSVISVSLLLESLDTASHVARILVRRTLLICLIVLIRILPIVVGV